MPPRPRSVIYLYMSGGMSHIDTFDPKPGTETGGPTQAIKTKTDGMQLAENLPLLANHADKIAVIRGMTSTKGAHQQGNYFMHTSYAQRSTIVHPSMGAWMTKLDGRFNPTLPGQSLSTEAAGIPCRGFCHLPTNLSPSETPTRVCETAECSRGFPSKALKKSLGLSKSSIEISFGNTT